MLNRGQQHLCGRLSAESVKERAGSTWRIVALSKPRQNGKGSAGYAPHVYDEATAKKLWDVSLQLVGMTDNTD